MSSPTGATSPPRTQSTLSNRAGIGLLGLLAGVMVLFALFGESGRELLRYERAAVFAGEYWRLVSGHLVHGTAWHLVLNLIGLCLIGSLFSGEYTLSEWLVIIVASVIAIDIGFIWLEPQLQWYVGFSGVLHGALAAGAISWWRTERVSFALSLTVIVVGKLAFEYWRGALPLAGGLEVVVEAHRYGAFGGLVAALAVLLARGVLKT